MAVGAVAEAVEGVDGEAVLRAAHQPGGDVGPVGGAQAHRLPGVVLLLVAQHESCPQGPEYVST